MHPFKLPYGACGFQEYYRDRQLLILLIVIIEGIQTAKRQFMTSQVRTQAERDAKRRKFRFPYALHAIVYDVRVAQQSTRIYTRAYARVNGREMARGGSTERVTVRRSMPVKFE